jgi:hypothetical protein
MKLFRSFLQAGFECSSHRNRWGTRLDLLESSQHDSTAFQDFAQLKATGVQTIRTGARWHRIEERPGQYDFSSLALTLDAAVAADLEVLLDLLHFGWPDHLDVFSRAFPKSFARFTHETVRFLKQRYGPRRFLKIAPVNEISFLSWAGGDVAALFPHTIGRGNELKQNLVRAAVRGSDVLLNELPNVRLIAPEPIIHIVGEPGNLADMEQAERYRLAQYQSWDLLCGRLEPELGGRPEFLDILGLNFYERNQWIHNSITPLLPGAPQHRPLREMIEEVWTRYGRPLFLAETGTEDEYRVGWLRYVCDEVAAALDAGIPVEGICWYPILDHPGWDDERHCRNGLLSYPNESGVRTIFQPLADEFEIQGRRLLERRENFYDSRQRRSDLSFTSPLGIRLPASATSDESLRPSSESLLH